MLADELDYVIGVDPYRDAHALVVVAATGGIVLVMRGDTRAQEPFGVQASRGIKSLPSAS